MSIKIGSLDFVNELIYLHFELRKTQLLLQIILNSSGIAITPQQLKQVEDEAIQFIQKKFPDLGITKKG